ncbi:MAG: beta-ketoacyl-[acyl-carrier-protein] synthase family protein [Chitinivibrionales bacterium]|nr:beta-ketoacyl-[acyl-carrier-protein] synthase family protein [Chitinivibrionales bacterium]
MSSHFADAGSALDTGGAAVTGIGIFSPIGNTPDAVLQSLIQAKNGLNPITRFDTTPFRSHIGGEIRDFDPSAYCTSQQQSLWNDRYLLLAIAAARCALNDAGLDLDTTSPHSSIGVVVGTCNAGLLSAETIYSTPRHDGNNAHTMRDAKELSHIYQLSQPSNLGLALANTFHITADTWVVTTACSSATCAIGLANMLIMNGYYSTVLVGASDALCLSAMAGFNTLKALTATTPAPFSLPYGFCMAEGACFWVIEQQEQARRRHARCYAQIAGFATSCEAYHPTTPEPRGESVAATLTKCLADSHLLIEDIGCINSHGTGTEANDRAESRGIAAFCGGIPIPVVALKSFVGHSMGSSGLIEATAQILAMNNGFIPPTLNFTMPRPGCTLDYVPNTKRDASYHAFVKASYAFGGNNAAVVIASMEKKVPRRTVDRLRVAITGVGALSCLGHDANGHIENIMQNRHGYRLVPALLPQTSSYYAGMVPAEYIATPDRRIDVASLNKISAFACIAALQALIDAHVAVTRKNSSDIGIAMGISNGADESEHMNRVFANHLRQGHSASFSSSTANSTAGWVAMRLCLKGSCMTFSCGGHSALQALAYGFDAVSLQQSRAMIVAGADELYPALLEMYESIGYCGTVDSLRLERNCGSYQLIPAEGAAAVHIEPLGIAQQRGAMVYAEILGYAMAPTFLISHPDSFHDLGGDLPAVTDVCRRAFQRSSVDALAIDCVIWASCGNASDIAVAAAIDAAVGRAVPFFTTTAHTGFIESASVLASLAVGLAFLMRDGVLPTGTHRDINDRLCRKTSMVPPEIILVIGSLAGGYTIAMVVRNGRYL